VIEIKIPKNLNINSFGGMLKFALSSEALKQTGDYFLFDFKDLSFADVAGIVGLGNLLKYLSSINFKIVFSNLQRESEVIKYMDDAGFFADTTGNRLNDESYTRSTTIPYFSFRDDAYNGYLFNSLTPWISREVDLSVDTLTTIRTCLEEAFHNVVFHSGVSSGCTLSQHYPQKKILKFALSDHGRGIPQLVRTIRDIRSDSQCIKIACEEGFTTKSNVRNRGAGLSILTKYVALRNNGRVQIRSGFGNVIASKSGDAVHFQLEDQSWSYPGTMVHVTLRTDTLERLEEDLEPEEFSW
jgi:anti-sigma regulatory factor (Ser/Thr protein kinase)/anti-anti-sigma regulatory factor